MLFEKSYEYGEHEGLGLLKGSVVPMEGSIPEKLKIPHIGWNALHFHRNSKLFRYINENDCVYFVHSFYASGCEDSLIATAEYGKELNKCGFRIDQFWCEYFQPDHEMPDDDERDPDEGPDEMFHFIKLMKI